MQFISLYMVLILALNQLMLLLGFCCYIILAKSIYNDHIPSLQALSKILFLNKIYETLCAIWYHLYYLKNLKNTHGGVLLLVKLEAKAPWYQMIPNRAKHLILFIRHFFKPGCFSII